MSEVNVEFKVCRKCNVEKSACDFPKDKTRKDGLFSYCKKCNTKNVLSYYEKDPQKTIDRVINWQRENKERYNQKSRDWRSNNLDYARTNKRIVERNRNSNKKNAGGKFTAEDIKNLKDAQNNLCAICKIDISVSYHIDHVMPIFLGGSNDISNIQILCPTCNLRKGKKHPDEFLAYMKNSI